MTFIIFIGIIVLLMVGVVKKNKSLLIATFISVNIAILYFCGFNIFGFILCAIASVIMLSVIGGTVDGIVSSKRDMYLANKYDEEYGTKE